MADKDLVLIGGGHAHVQVLRRFGMRPEPGVRLTLVARDVETPYSGMLPGFVAGHYGHDDIHIDLMHLARFAGARVIHDEATGLDRAAGRVLCRRQPPLRYDVVSLDIGSAPRADAVPGAAEHAVPVKPVDRLAARWRTLMAEAEGAERPLAVTVVGGGPAGTELVLAMHHRLGARVRPALVTRGALLAHHDPRVAAALRRVLAERGVTLHEHAPVARVEPDGLVLADGRRLPADRVLWTTQAGAAPWLADTGLALDAGGFVRVAPTLRSVTDPRVFAAGDVASMDGHPRPKAGVFAVRHGPPLAANLRRSLRGEPLRPFVPQTRFLSLIATGDRAAVASRGPFVARGRWVWRWKDWIDRRFMRAFRDLPEMPPASPAMVQEMRCGGCGAKVPAAALARALDRLGGVGPRDDAAVLDAPGDGRLLVQTVDHFRAFVDDPYVFGRIAANHALGDIHAMGAQPLAALAIAAVPPHAPALVEEDLFRMLAGARAVLEAAGARLVGGHSGEAAEPALGFAVTGAVHPDRILRKGGLRAGDRLVLTKALGTGTLLAAAMRGRVPARHVAAALEAMQRPAGPAAACLMAHGATAATDVTGFGLYGHLMEMLEASDADAVLDADAIPALPGALGTLASGVVSTLHPANAAAAPHLRGGPRVALLFDPQTAGGLLAGIPAGRAAACVTALRALGCADAAVIGAVTGAVPGSRRVVVRPAGLATDGQPPMWSEP
ncbi:selenide, water dikinase SelD [Azospirillum halopraeferens]|uniref:selenide, water dikinase SelD n=1 Tax=Azospirillum halopraeferens TaxID=34010 RepID=UPI0003F80BE9|nr:selenide, water dikinase SelD [Azospirillum halopraeferens]